ncbi:MAG: hypothetical protein ACWA41_10945 [Putridiphycobacter sp.]
MTIFEAFILIGGTHKIISFIKPSLIPQNLNEAFYHLKMGNVKAYRLAYLPLIALMFISPEFSLKTIVMVISIELSFVLVPRIVNWIFSKFN